MARYHVSNAKEWATIYDHHTGHEVICTTRECVNYLLREHLLPHCNKDDCGCLAGNSDTCAVGCRCRCHEQVIYCAKRPLMYLADSKCFSHDDLPTPRNIDLLAQTLEGKLEDTPFPFPYAQMVLVVLLLFAIILPVQMSIIVNSTPIAVIIVLLTTWVFCGVLHILLHPRSSAI